MTSCRPLRCISLVAMLLACGVATTGRALAQGACAASPSANPTLSTVPVATGVPGRLLFVAAPPGDSNRLFIVAQDGFIHIHKRGDPPGVATTFLDISAVVQAAPQNDEMGLLGL